MPMQFCARRARRRSVVAAALSILAAPVIVWAQIQAYSFDIPAQDLASALQAFGKQSKQQLVFDGSDVRGKSSAALMGTYSADEGIKRLLAGTGLGAKRTGSGVIAIHPIEVGAINSDSGLEEVVVTANKRIENIQEVAVAVSVERGERLSERGVTSLADYAASVPGFNVASSGTPGQTAVSIRGISSNTSTSAVGAYIDDTPMGSSSGWANGSFTLLDMLPYDLDRLEVLRGPQGTLYGEGSMGGLVKYVLKTPSTNDFQVSAGADLSAIDGAGSAGYAVRSRVNMPLVGDVLGVAISAFGQRTPGYLTNSFTGQRDTNLDRQYGARLAVLWTPTANLSMKLTALTSVIEADDSAWRQFGDATPVPGVTGALIFRPINPLPDLTQSVPFPASYDQHLFYGAATIDWNPGPFDVVSATSWSRQRSFNGNDVTPLLGSILPFLGGTAPGLVQSADFFGLNKVTQELRLVSPKGGRIEWLAGAFYTHEHAMNLQYMQAFDLHYQPTAPAFPPGLFYSDFPSNFNEYAAFGNLTWNLTSAWSITAGGRYAYNDQNISFYTANGPLYPAPLPNYVDITTHQGVFTWMGTVQYRIDRDTMAYARVATGYRPGGPNSPLPGIPTNDKADTLTNYELGLKSTFLDHKVLVNLSVYRIDWKDIQLIAVEPGSSSFLANGGKALSQGVELESHYSPVRALTLGLNASYTDSHLTSVIPESSYLAKGYQLPLVPKETVSVMVDYAFPPVAGWAARVGADYRYNGRSWQSLVETDSPLSTPTFSVPGYSVVNLNAGVSKDHLAVKLYARNLANSRALVGGGYGILTNSATGARPTVGAFLQPRTVGVGFDYEF